MSGGAPSPPGPAADLWSRVLRDCGGDHDVAGRVLAWMFLSAGRGVSPGFLRLGPGCHPPPPS